MDYYLDNILAKGVLTGSRAFNCATDTSDYDIVITKSQLPAYKEADDWQIHNICHAEDLSNCDEVHSDTDDNELEYDQVTIWGPIRNIIKYWYLTDPEDESSSVCINLFVYPDKYAYLYDNFKKLNTLMLLTNSHEYLMDKDNRIDAFVEIINKVGITEA